LERTFEIPLRYKCKQQLKIQQQQLATE